MMVFKRKQIVILSLILMVVVAGYLQYSYKQGSSSANKDAGKLGEPVFVNETTDSQDVGVAGKDIKKDDKKKDTAASKLANDYFAQTKLDQELSRSKDTDALKAITEDVNASKETKAKAYDQMIGMIDTADQEARIEALIKEKNFSDALVLFGDDGSIDVVIKTPSLTNAQIAQIADVVSRQAKVDMEKIHVRNLY